MTCTKKLRTFVLCALLLGGHQSLHAQGTYEEAPFEEEEFKGPNRRSSGNRSQSTFVQGLRFGTKFNFSIYGNEMLYGLEPTIGYQLLEEIFEVGFGPMFMHYHNWGGFSKFHYIQTGGQVYATLFLFDGIYVRASARQFFLIQRQQGNRATARTQNVYLEGGYQYQVGDRYWATAGLEMNLIETPYASRRYLTPTFGFRMAF